MNILGEKVMKPWNERILLGNIDRGWFC